MASEERLSDEQLHYISIGDDEPIMSMATELIALRALVRRCHARAISINALAIRDDIRLVVGEGTLRDTPK